MEHLFLMFLDHTQRRTTVGRTPLDEWSARHRDLHLTTHDTHNRQISMSPVGFGHRPLACWDLGFESHRGHGYLSVVSVVCCQVEVSATSWSLVQRVLPTVVRRCVWSRNIKNRCSIYIYDIISLRVKSRSFLLRMRNVSDNNRTENQNTHFVFNNFHFESIAVYAIMWKNIVERGRLLDNTVQALCILDT